MNDLYEILGVSRQASEQDIKKAYRTLAMKYHPDRNQGDADAEAKFKEVSQAYEILSNPEKKNNYDNFGNPNGPQGGFGGGHHTGSPFDIFDMFNEVFGQSRGHGDSRANKPGKDLEVRAPITFMESIFGCEKELRITVNMGCTPCNSTGSSTGKTLRCRACSGAGFVVIRQAFMRVNAQCNECVGKGIVPEQICKDCSGRGQVPGVDVIKISIPPGIDNGTRVRVTGRGQPNSMNTRRGDLYVQLNVEPHPEFVKDGKDIRSTVKMPFHVAALGGTLAVNTVHGVQDVKIAPGTQSNSTLRLKKQGVPGSGSRPVGHHLVQLVVDVPQQLTSQQAELIRKLNL